MLQQSSPKSAPRSLWTQGLRAFGKCLVGRAWILSVNLVVVYIIIQMLRSHGVFPKRLDHELLESITGVGVILIGWGVALEERHALRSIFHLIGSENEAREAWIDDICHKYGVGFLVLGLFSEIFVELVKLPNDIFNTIHLSEALVIISEALIAICGVLLLPFSMRLLKKSDT